MPDAVVIGAGPNGLVAANLLADAGWSVEVFEAQPEPGGAVRSDRGVHPDYVSDVFSAFYPLAAASPVIASLCLDREGLVWSHAPRVLAHPLADGRCAVLDRVPHDTAAGLDEFGPGDGDAWTGLCKIWDRLGPDIVRGLFTPFPPLVPAARLLDGVRRTGGLATVRRLLLPVRRLAEEEFRAEAGGLLLAGNALHADLPPEAAGSGGYGWLMSMLGQHHGFPVPAGGAGELTAALVRRLERRGGAVHCDAPITEVVVRAGRAVGVRTAAGEGVPARRAVLADVSAPALYGSLVGEEHLPGSALRDLRRFQWDFATFKVDWALDSRVPWTAPQAATAGTVHLADGMDGLTAYAARIATGLVPENPFLIFGQMTAADATRSPAGTESAWAYTHLPQKIKGDAGEQGLTGRWEGSESEAMADRMEEVVERYAPGFRARVLGRRILTPPTMEAMDANLRGGALNGGTAALHQQLVFRPVPSNGRPETPVKGLFLASASAHPGGGVHGAPGANAARAALRRHLPTVLTVRRRRLQRPT
ncbi:MULTISPECIES: phytoene desaturase family protein [Streptomyces]|uniref:Pyridine nucleotide-disulfide oxidoreductase domain-containing protein 2 n=1 Tax=Streptomyces venezuelae (strain ATCC 10712 / CBS 650.69 / DSM 40230 / JCM 4526 / NBRC 13096 / PD 04745) TaxID=953739 RepID=F2R355_STRVP|nr:NAD(P)/FAD-dependent oxidoreductase [Streptomyces venezuelae]QER96968.1 NAD(P)/FAD-dependent oxidoreductase [Streptomyces venezuelae ATCC 10712]CCA53301.1 Beta-carotene ketolase [Streptomyces venezuelae ATCC 10712]